MSAHSTGHQAPPGSGQTQLPPSEAAALSSCHRQGPARSPDTEQPLPLPFCSWSPPPPPEPRLTEWNRQLSCFRKSAALSLGASRPAPSNPILSLLLPARPPPHTFPPGGDCKGLPRSPTLWFPGPQRQPLAVRQSEGGHGLERRHKVRPACEGHPRGTPCSVVTPLSLHVPYLCPPSALRHNQTAVTSPRTSSLGMAVGDSTGCCFCPQDTRASGLEE